MVVLAEGLGLQALVDVLLEDAARRMDLKGIPALDVPGDPILRRVELDVVHAEGQPVDADVLDPDALQVHEEVVETPRGVRLPHDRERELLRGEAVHVIGQETRGVV